MAFAVESKVFTGDWRRHDNVVYIAYNDALFRVIYLGKIHEDIQFRVTDVRV